MSAPTVPEVDVPVGRAERGQLKRPAITRRVRIPRRQLVLQTLASLTLLLVVWELLARFAGISPLILPPVTAIAEEMAAMNQEGILLENILISLGVYAVGMAVSVVIGVPLGLAIGGLRTLGRAASPYLWAIYSTPGVIIMPIILLWVGINDTARVLLVVVKALPAIAVVVMDGVKTVDGDLLETARSFSASRRDLFRRIILPSTLPFVGTGVRMGVSRGLVGLFIGELFTSTNGIGYILSLSQTRFNTARTFAILLIFVLFSVLLVSLSRVVERRFSVWRE